MGQVSEKHSDVRISIPRPTPVAEKQCFETGIESCLCWCIEGVSSQMLLNKMKSTNKSICQKSDLVEEIGKRDIEILMTMGAGDIDTFVIPIKNKLSF